MFRLSTILCCCRGSRFSPHALVQHVDIGSVAIVSEDAETSSTVIPLFSRRVPSFEFEFEEALFAFR